MIRRSNRRVLVPVLAVLLAGAATAVYQAVRSFAQVVGDSRTGLAEETPVISEGEGTERSHAGSEPREATSDELSYPHLFPGGSYDDRVIAGLDKVEQMPRTDYPDYRPISAGDNKLSKAWSVHCRAQLHFKNASGFGSFRMVYAQNERGGHTAHAAIDRVELVSLLTSSEPNAYVIDEMATPRIAKVAKRRPIDAFESAALKAVQNGENLVYSPVVSTRMFGAIRADGTCIRCHAGKREGDLLGAFTYWLRQPVDKIEPSR